VTTQIILFNMHGAVVATDSAVTFGNGRVYETSEKLFCLPQPHKIAVLHSGNVWIHNVTQMQLVTEWSMQLDPKPKWNVEAYAIDFTNWIEVNGARWIAEAAVHQSMLSAIEDVFERLSERLEDCNNPDTIYHLDFHGRVSLFAKRIRQFIDLLDAYPEPIGHCPARLFDASEALAQRLEELIEAQLCDIPPTPEIKRLMWELVDVAMAKSPSLTGGTLSFVGYGGDDIAPAFTTVHLGMLLQGSLFLLPGESAKFEPGVEKYAGIEVLGQDPTIALVLQQFNHYTIGTAASVVRNHLRLVADSLPLTPDTAETHGLIDRPVADSRANTTTDFETFLGEPSHDILRKTISGLPLETLADIARQLITTEILTKTITCQTPTVGGPIKMVTITRAGGCSSTTPFDRAA